MPRVAPHIPAESDLLCEKCGYILNGLPEESRCPECGKPIAESLPELRQPAPVELGRGFFKTSFQILFRPAYFYRHLATRHISTSQKWFARTYRIIVAILLGFATFIHINWYDHVSRNYYGISYNFRSLFIIIAVLYVLLDATTYWAARLSAWEAKYRGMRLSCHVVLRGLHFHYVHYLPIAILFFATTAIHNYLVLKNIILPSRSDMYYLYILCAEVILSAGYLFWTYWIAMRNMMYANR